MNEWLHRLANRIANVTVEPTLQQRQALEAILKDPRRKTGFEVVSAIASTFDPEAGGLSLLRAQIRQHDEAAVVALCAALGALLLPWPDAVLSRRFRGLSERLTGFASLDDRLTDLHLLRLLVEPLGDTVGAAIEVLESAPEANVASLLAQHPDIKPVVEAWVFQLYIGDTPVDATTVLPPADATAHFGALFWRAAEAHPPMLAGGYFGHWHYRPED